MSINGVSASAIQFRSSNQTCLGIGKCVSGWSDKGPTKTPKRFEGALSDSFISAIAIIVGYGLVQKKMWFWLQSMSYNSLACTSFYTNAALL